MRAEDVLRKQDLITLQIIGEMIDIKDIAEVKKDKIIDMIIDYCSKSGCITVLGDLTVASLHDIYETIKDKKSKDVKTRAALSKHLQQYVEEHGAEKFLKKVPEDIKPSMFSHVSDTKTTTTKSLLNEATLTGFANLLNRANTQILRDMVKKFSKDGQFKKKEMINFLVDDEDL